MTEADWNCCADPHKMLDFLTGSGELSERKARLFAVACCRRVWEWMTDERSRHAVDVAEQYADGLVGQKKLKMARRAAFSASKSSAPSVSCRVSEHAATVALDACLNGKKHGPLVIAYATAGCASSLLPLAVRHAAEATERAEQWYGAPHSERGLRESQERGEASERASQCELLRDIFGPLLFRAITIASEVLHWNNGTVRRLADSIYAERAFDQLPVLADALEDGGCSDEEILQHCRQRGGVHVRGCWLLDILLGKS